MSSERRRLIYSAQSSAELRCIASRVPMNRRSNSSTLSVFEEEGEGIGNLEGFHAIEPQWDHTGANPDTRRWRFERHDLRDGAVAVGNDDSGPPLHPLQHLAQMGFELGDLHGLYETKIGHDRSDVNQGQWSHALRIKTIELNRDLSDFQSDTRGCYNTKRPFAP